MADEKLAGITYPKHQQRVFTEDWQKEQSSIGQEITHTRLDILGAGVVTGGSIAVGVGSATVDLTEKTVAYDAEGRRIEAPATAGIDLSREIDLSSDVSGTVVIRHKFNPSQVINPQNTDNQALPIEYRDNSSEILFRTGALSAGDVALREGSIDTAGAVTLGADRRQWAQVERRNIAPVRNEDLPDDKITSDKLHPDSKIGTKGELVSNIKNKIVGTFNIIKALNAAENLRVEKRKEVGELFWLADYRPWSADFPAVCLLRDNYTLSQSRWPDLVPYLYNQRAVLYGPHSSNVSSSFNVTSAGGSGYSFSIALADNTHERNFISALVEDQLVHGSYSNWRTITFTNAKGGIPPNTYRITSINAANRSIGFRYHTSVSSGGGSVSGVYVSHYPYRIAGTSSQVRLYKLTAATLFQCGPDSDGHWVGGLRKRDQMQGHTHTDSGHKHPVPVYGPGTYEANHKIQIRGSNAAGLVDTHNSNAILGNPTEEDHDIPRYGHHTRSKGLAAFAYIWGGRYIR